MARKNAVEIDAGATASVEDVDTMLAELEASELTDDSGDIVVEEPVEVENEDDLAAAVGELAIEEVKAEAYAEAEADPVAEPAAAEPKKAKQAKKAEGEKKARAPRVADDLPGDAFVLETTDNADDLTGLKAAVLASKPSQKKIEEKFHNVLTAVAAGRKPSVYVMTAFQALKASGSVASTEITAAMQAAGYSIGTSRSQTGQVMALFPILKIASRDGNKLTLNPNSTLAMALDALSSAPAAEDEEKEAA